ncbi:unnamed protein product [Mytilus coruscus]|uniref:Tyr recombinase domain-containing protein n=1 Tax=Mytilus coruscus TaxID=42192 RepID=A0A6J8AS33_MYTCO|nr:unnamed protein product [Mytilus coruscus]
MAASFMPPPISNHYERSETVNRHAQNDLNTMPVYSVRSFGVPAYSISDTDMISPEIRQQIITGKDVNLNTLLIPNYEIPVKRKTQENDDRLIHNLSLDEFIIAFGRFKRIMCSAFPTRAEELELYLTHIVETAIIWPHKFFEYHRMFSAKCATMLLQHNIEIDWSKGDIELKQKIVLDLDIQCGFDMLVSESDIITYECKNALSARRDPETVQTLIDDELRKGFINGPFDVLPFASFRIKKFLELAPEAEEKPTSCPSLTGYIICPVLSILKYNELRQSLYSPNTESFFISEDRKFLNRKIFISHVKILLDKLGLSSKSYNGHSFRIGAATSAHEARLEDHLIQTLDRWSLDCYTRYIHTSPYVLKDAQKQYAETDLNLA